MLSHPSPWAGINNPSDFRDVSPVLVIFFSPYNFSYLLKQSRENFRDETEDLESTKCDPEKEHPVDFPVKNKGCTKRGRDLLTVQEFMDGESLGCYKGKAFY